MSNLNLFTKTIRQFHFINIVYEQRQSAHRQLILIVELLINLDLKWRKLKIILCYNGLLF